GDLRGLLVQDERDPKQVMSYLAERGRIISNDNGSYLVMFEGYVQRYNAEDANKGGQIIAFGQNMLDISEFSPKDTDDQGLHPREVYIRDPNNLDPNDKIAKQNYGQFRSELHERLSTPLSPLAFVVI